LLNATPTSGTPRRRWATPVIGEKAEAARIFESLIAESR
jgi:hypothetical protein